MNYKNLLLITSRKGSVRIKNKNIYKVNKIPLISYTLSYAKKHVSKYCIAYTSTDCEESKKLSLKQQIPTLSRKKKLANNTVSHFNVIRDAIDQLNKKNIYFEYLTLLQPTSPLRNENLIKNSIKILDKNKSFSSLIELVKIQNYTGKIKKNNVWVPDYFDKRSQDIPKSYMPTGNIFVFRISKTFMVDSFYGKKTYSLINNSRKWVNIDYVEDLMFFRSILNGEKHI